MTGHPVRQILIVDDDPADVSLMCDALHERGVESDLLIAGDAETAIRYLDRVDANGSFPDLVMLDLNLPGQNGLEVLKRIRRSRLCSIPVLMMTGSQSVRDRDEAMALGAAAFVNKPVELLELIKIADLVTTFVAALPRGG